MKLKIDMRPLTSGTWNVVGAALGALSLAALTAPALADVQISIERLSDTRAILHADGTIPNEPRGGLPHWIVLGDPFTTSPGFHNSNVFVSSTMFVGDVPINFAYDFGYDYGFPTPMPIVYLGSSVGVFEPADPVSGDVLLQLTFSTWAAVGSSGTVYWGGAPYFEPAGTWQMLPAGVVPEAASAQMLLAGLLVLAFALHRRSDPTGVLS